MEMLKEAYEASQGLKTGERSEQQRRLAILATEVAAFAAYVNEAM